jgi:chromosome partitioning protein
VSRLQFATGPRTVGRSFTVRQQSTAHDEAGHEGRCHADDRLRQPKGRVDQASVTAAFVIVDLEGTASLMVGYAISRADLVIVPTQGSLLDATEAVKAIRLVRNMEKTAGKTIPTAVLLTRTSAAIRPRSLQAIEAEFANSGVRILETQMHERDAFRAIFSFGGSLSDLDRSQVGNVPAAIANARAFAAEVLAILKPAGAREAAEAA